MASCLRGKGKIFKMANKIQHNSLCPHLISSPYLLCFSHIRLLAVSWTSQECSQLGAFTFAFICLECCSLDILLPYFLQDFAPVSLSQWVQPWAPYLKLHALSTLPSPFLFQYLPPKPQDLLLSNISVFVNFWAYTYIYVGKVLGGRNVYPLSYRRLGTVIICHLDEWNGNSMKEEPCWLVHCSAPSD